MNYMGQPRDYTPDVIARATAEAVTAAREAIARSKARGNKAMLYNEPYAYDTKQGTFILQPYKEKKRHSSKYIVLNGAQLIEYAK